MDQLSVIFSVIGAPSQEDMDAFGLKATEYIKTLLGSIKHSKPIQKLFPAADPVALDLLDKMLQFNPNKRLTAQQALQHPFLKNVQREQMERGALEVMQTPEFLNASKMDLKTLKQKTYEEVLWFRDNQERTTPQQQQASSSP